MPYITWFYGKQKFTLLQQPQTQQQSIFFAAAAASPSKHAIIAAAAAAAKLASKNTAIEFSLQLRQFLTKKAHPNGHALHCNLDCEVRV